MVVAFISCEMRRKRGSVGDQQRMNYQHGLCISFSVQRSQTVTCRDDSEARTDGFSP